MDPGTVYSAPVTSILCITVISCKTQHRAYQAKATPENDHQLAAILAENYFINTNPRSPTYTWFGIILVTNGIYRSTTEGSILLGLSHIEYMISQFKSCSYMKNKLSYKVIILHMSW